MEAEGLRKKSKEYAEKVTGSVVTDVYIVAEAFESGFQCAEEKLKEENAKLREENDIIIKTLEHFASIPTDVINSFPATTAQQMQANAITAMAKLRSLHKEALNTKEQ